MKYHLLKRYSTLLPVPVLLAASFVYQTCVFKPMKDIDPYTKMYWDSVEKCVTVDYGLGADKFYDTNDDGVLDLRKRQMLMKVIGSVTYDKTTIATQPEIFKEINKTYRQWRAEHNP
ncbi:MAG: hypothetical protein WC916_04030 [Candidatus Woesearchaeota archaeon]